MTMTTIIDEDSEQRTSRTPLGCAGGDHSTITESALSARTSTFNGGPEGTGTTSRSRDPHTCPVSKPEIRSDSDCDTRRKVDLGLGLVQGGRRFHN